MAASARKLSLASPPVGEHFFPSSRPEGEDADLEVDSLFHVILEGTCDVQVPPHDPPNPKLSLVGLSPYTYAHTFHQSPKEAPQPHLRPKKMRQCRQCHNLLNMRFTFWGSAAGFQISPEQPPGHVRFSPNFGTQP